MNIMGLKKKSRAGFTLVELIVVIAILAILAGVAIPVYSGYIKKANEAADNMLLSAVNTAFAAACAENGEYNTKALGFTPTASLNNANGETVTVSKFNDEFQRYFSGNGKFKYFNVLTFVRSEGVFTGTTEGALTAAMKESWGSSSFSSADGSSEKQLLGMFDEIEGVFGRNAGLLSLLVDAAKNDPMMKALISDLGIDTLKNAMDMDEAQLQAIVRAKAEKDPSFIEGYASMTDEEKAAAIAQKALDLENTIKGNAAVLQVAADATGHTTADVQSSLGGMMGIVNAAMSGLSDEQLEAYLAANVDGYATMTDEQKAAAREAAEEQLNATAITLGGVELSNGALLAMQQAMQGNTTLDDGGVSTLGALFALTQGFYSDPSNYTGEKPPMNGGTNMLQAVFAAVSDEKFMAYYSTHGEADITAYLDAMSVMSAHSGEIDLTSNQAFTEQYAFIAELLEITTP